MPKTVSVPSCQKHESKATLLRCHSSDDEAVYHFNIFLQKYTVTYISALIHLAEDFIPTCFVFIEIMQPRSSPSLFGTLHAAKPIACLLAWLILKEKQQKKLYTSLSEKRAAAETWTGFATYKKTKFEKS